MKITDIHKLGLQTQTLQDCSVNPLELIVRDELNKGTDDYQKSRKCAIKRTLAAGVSFTSEINSFGDLLKLVLVPRCPKCREFLKLELGGGNIRPPIP